MVYRPAKATIVESTRNADVITTVLHLDQVIPSPVAPASLWPCDASGPSTPVMELHKVVAHRGNELTFETYGRDHEPLTVGSAYTIGPWWASSQLDTARSDAARWQRQAFVPSDAAVFRRADGKVLGRKLEDGEAIPEGAELLPGAWEHVHCRLCWETISQVDDDDRVGYTDGCAWLCEECYDKFIASGFGKRLGDVL